jgi:hypothetical protein
MSQGSSLARITQAHLRARFKFQNYGQQLNANANIRRQLGPALGRFFKKALARNVTVKAPHTTTPLPRALALCTPHAHPLLPR